MERAVGSTMIALIFVLSVMLVNSEQRARCKTLYPPYAITSEDAQFVSDPYEEGTWDGRMYASKHANGDDSLEVLRLSIKPGKGWPPHRHLEADEWMYVISGKGVYAYWALEEVQPTNLSIAPGHALYNPQGQLHKVWNSGMEPLVLLAVSKSLAPYEVLRDWPDAPGGGLGYVPHAAPWELSCAPGHEPDEREATEPEPQRAGGGDWAGDWAAAAAEASDGDDRSGGEGGFEPSTTEGEAPFAEEEEPGEGPGDYEAPECGGVAGGEDLDWQSMSEGEIAECMAEPDFYNDDMDYDRESYGGHGEYDNDDDEEPEFPELPGVLEAGAVADGAPPVVHDAGEL